MKEMVHERQMLGTGGTGADLLSNLVEASNQEKDGEQKLLDSELIGTLILSATTLSIKQSDVFEIDRPVYVVVHSITRNYRVVTKR